MATDFKMLHTRHIQNFSEAKALEYHWGYGNRAVPCTNDAGSCEYLDVVYWAHDMGILYSAILWCTLLAILFLWALGRRIWPSRRGDEVMVEARARARARAAADVEPGGAVARYGWGDRLKRTMASYSRSYLLPDAARSVFGRTTRLQVVVLGLLSGYLLIWTFAGITYKTWITPVKSSPALHNTRVSLGPWADRVGTLAYALTPLSILLSSRESILSVVTGLPYQTFNFLHRWLGYIIFVQSSLHAIGWCIIETRLYQPQPSTAMEWITQTYMIWGIVAILLLLLLFLLSTPWGIRLTGYETFRKLHYLLAMVYIGACWAHWKLLEAFLWPALALWLLDRAVRLARTALIHYQFLPGHDSGPAFRAVHATLAHFPDADNGDVVRLDFAHSQEPWQVGQHFYLCFAACSIWQSHPFTPLNLPELKGGLLAHSYIFRARAGETKRVAELAARKLSDRATVATTPLVLAGPYGESSTEYLTPDVNVLCVAGGTGITYVLPVLLGLVRQGQGRPPAHRSERKIELVWAVRREADMRWVQPELDQIRRSRINVKVRIFVTREQGPADGDDDEKKSGQPSADAAHVRETTVSSSVSSASAASAASAASLEVKRLGGDGDGDGVDSHHPALRRLVRDFVDGTVTGPTTVYASGPGGMLSDLRTVVAGCNSAASVWKGDDRFDVTLTTDNRLEW